MVADLLSGAGEGDRIEIREQLGEMVDQLAEGVDAALEATADLDSADRISMRQAEASLAALRAAHTALAAARQRV
ncbi:hypothetical protein CR162_18865 [Pseudoroseomonas rhizosphaerae]|uniref:Uncharacterized protein n=1 Tax=Teichococcus rhizosphaerae TaxID=1335062 RepID=A0A2C7A5Y5_9PROT|nr:hypothetical protein [Pseudoroseomonas rhizosphaerae]PHK93399.1 hypothetical protein CR162_18865 [Pseudoroseomonas rhizosphaerae]